MSGFEFDGSFDDFVNTVGLISRNYPKEVRKYMQKEGNKLKKITLRIAKASVKKKTGNYFEGIKRGKYYRYASTGADSIRVYVGSPANHGHLIEYGHEVVTRNGESAGRYVHGKRVFKKAEIEFEDAYGKDCEKFADELVAKLE